MAEVKWNARRLTDGVMVDVTADIDGMAQPVPSENPIEAGSTGTFVASPSDPGAIGAGSVWKDTSGGVGAGAAWRERNADNTGWLQIVRPQAHATGAAAASAGSQANSVNGDADVNATAIASGDGSAYASPSASSAGAGDAQAWPSASTSGAGGAYVGPTAIASGSGDADATSTATANTGVPTSGVKAIRGADEASLTVKVTAAGLKQHIITGLPTADPTVAGQLWNDGGTLKVSAG